MSVFPVFRRAAAVAALVTLSAGLAPAPSRAAAPPDTTGHWARAEVTAALSAGIASGDPEGTFRPDAPVSRAEFVKLMVTARGLDLRPGDPPAFADVSGHWVHPYLAAAVRAGIVHPADYPQGFQPGGTITRQEMAVLLARTAGLGEAAMALSDARLDFPDASAIGGRWRGHVAVASWWGLLKGMPDGTFQPNGGTTRAQAVVVVLRLLYRIGTLLVADTGNNRVVGITRNGTKLFEIGGLDRPHDARWLANGNILVADTGNARILEVTPAGQVVWQLGNLPDVHGAAQIDPDLFLVAQPALNRVQAVDRRGNVAWQAPGQAPAALDRPHDAEDPPAVVAVANTGRDEILLIDKLGQLLRRLDRLNDGTRIRQPLDVDFAGGGLVLLAFADEVALAGWDGQPHFRRRGLLNPTDAERLGGSTYFIAEEGADRILEVDAALGVERAIQRLSDGTRLSRPHAVDLFRTSGSAEAFDTIVRTAQDHDREARRAYDDAFQVRTARDRDREAAQRRATDFAMDHDRAVKAVEVAAGAVATAEAHARAAAAAEADAAAAAGLAMAVGASSGCASAYASVQASAYASARAAARAKAAADAAARAAANAHAYAEAQAEAIAAARARADAYAAAVARAWSAAVAWSEAWATARAEASAYARAAAEAAAYVKASDDGFVAAFAGARARAAAQAYADARARAWAAADAYAAAFATASAEAEVFVQAAAGARARADAAVFAAAEAEAHAEAAAAAAALAAASAEAVVGLHASLTAVASGSCATAWGCVCRLPNTEQPPPEQPYPPYEGDR